MKATVKLFFLLTFCFAALCSMRDFSYQINGLSVSIPKNNAAPFFKIVQNNTLYYAKIQSLYEIYQKNDSLWYKLPETEVKFNSLNWNCSLDFDNDTFSLVGAPCPCPSQQEQPEQFLNRRNHLDSQNLNNLDDCPVINFDSLSFNVHLNNNGNCSLPDLDSCVANCTQACNSSTNSTSCVNGCNAITDITILDSNICNNTCGNDTICFDSCYSLFDCLTNSTCSMRVNYNLNNYRWSNISELGDNVTRKLVFAFKIIPQYNQQQCCATQFDYWIRGNYSLFFNTTTLSMDLSNVTSNSDVDISNATEITSNIVWALRGEAVFGRVYFDDLLSGYSLFNNYPVVAFNSTVPDNSTVSNPNTTDNNSIPQTRRNLDFSSRIN